MASNTPPARSCFGSLTLDQGMHIIATVSILSAPISIYIALQVLEFYMLYSSIFAVLLAVFLLSAIKSRNPKHANLAYGMGLIHCVCTLRSAFLLYVVTDHKFAIIFAIFAFLLFAYMSFMVWSFQKHLRSLRIVTAPQQTHAMASLQPQQVAAAPVPVVYQPPPQTGGDSSIIAGSAVNNGTLPPPAYNYSVPPRQ